MWWLVACAFQLLDHQVEPVESPLLEIPVQCRDGQVLLSGNAALCYLHLSGRTTVTEYQRVSFSILVSRLKLYLCYFNLPTMLADVTSTK